MPHRLKHDQIERILEHKATGPQQRAAGEILQQCSHRVTDVEVMRMAASALALLGAENELLAGKNGREQADNLWHVAHNLLRDKHRRQERE